MGTQTEKGRHEEGLLHNDLDSTHAKERTQGISAGIVRYMCITSVSCSMTLVSSSGDLTAICVALFLVVDATAAHGSP
jgi:hypothetical protein